MCVYLSAKVENKIGVLNVCLNTNKIFLVFRIPFFISYSPFLLHFFKPSLVLVRYSDEVDFIKGTHNSTKTI